MRMKKVISEKVKLQEILEGGFSTKNPTLHELIIIAKHFRQNEGFGKNRIVTAVGEFMKSKDSDITLSPYEDLIIKATGIALKNSELQHPNFPILVSSDELSAIEVLGNIKYQRVAFACLVVAKSTGNKSTFSDDKKNLSHILKVSGVRYYKSRRFTVKRFIEEFSHLAYLGNIFEHINKRVSFYRIMCSGIGDICIRINSIDELENAGNIYESYIDSQSY